MARLILQADGNERVVPLEATDVTIGRDDKCTIRIEDTKSSRQHCAVRRLGAEYVLEDLGSSNGTQVNGQRVDKRPLRDGDVITIGRTSLRFSGDAPAGDEAGDASTEPADDLVLERDGGDAIPLRGTVSVGRAPGNTVILEGDAKVSGKHAEFFVRDGVPMVKDVGSTNGTRVDGQKITETPLRQGARVEVGHTIFTFKNRALPDVLESGNLLESGALGADFAAAGARAAGRRLGGTLVTMVLLGGALFGVVQLAKGMASEGGTRIEGPAGNLCPANYSFEGGATSDGAPYEWTAVAEGADRVAVEKTAGATGTMALVLERMPGVAPDKVSECFAPDIALRAGRALKVSVRAKAAGVDGVAGVRVVWARAGREGPVEESWGPVVTGDAGFATVEQVLTPPDDGAVRARVSLAILGKGGRATFDDLVVTDTAAPAAAAAAGTGLNGTVLSDARFAVRAGDSAVCFSGSAWAVAGDGRARPVVSRAKGPGDGAKAEAEVFDAGTAKWLPVSVAAAPGAGGTVSVRVAAGDGSGARAVAASCLLGTLRVSQGVGIVGPEGWRAPGDEFEAAGVSQLLLGGTHNLVALRFSPPVRATLAREGGVPRLTVVATAPDGGAPALTIEAQADFAAPREAADKAISDAGTHERESRLGQALAAYEAIATTYAFDRTKAQRVEKPLAGLRAKAQRAVATLREALDEALFPTPSVPRLEETVRAAQDAAGRWIGTDAGQQVAALREKAANDLREARIAEGQQRAESLLVRGRDFARLKQPTLARVLLDKVAREFDGTPWAEEARKTLATLPPEAP